MYGDLVARIKKMQAKMLLMHEMENAKDFINLIQTSKKHFFIAINFFNNNQTKRKNGTND